MLFVTTDIARFKSVVKQAINLANNKLGSSLEQCVELAVTDNGTNLFVTALNSSYGVKLLLPLEGTINVDGTCLIHYSKLLGLLNKISPKAHYLKVSNTNNQLVFSLLDMGSVADSVWSDNNTLYNSKFLDENDYIVLDEDNTVLVPHLLVVSDIAKSCDNSVINIRGDNKQLCISSKFGVSGNNLFSSKLDSIGNIVFAIKPHLLTNTLSFLGDAVTIGYNNTNKWLMFSGDKGVVCYKSLASITNIEKTITNILGLEEAGTITVKRSELDLAIAFHADGDYINLSSDTTNTLLQVFSSSSKEPAKLKLSLYNGGFIDTKLELNHLKQALTLTNNTCPGVSIAQRVTTFKDSDVHINILVITSPDNGAIETTTIVYACI